MSTAVDPFLSSLSDEVLRLVEDQLSNNDVASDEELHAHFIAKGLTDVQATRALHYRSHYLQTIYLEGHTPIRKGKQAIRFDPHRRQFELIRC